VKEAAGVLTNNKSLKREGKMDQAVGSIKEGTEKVVNAAKDALAQRKRR
jgi:uncharacterized protein YjbJ (UPF0337 family)